MTEDRALKIAQSVLHERRRNDHQYFLIKKGKEFADNAISVRESDDAIETIQRIRDRRDRKCGCSKCQCSNTERVRNSVGAFLRGLRS